MKKIDKKTKTNSTNKNIAIAAGVTGLFASALLGAHFLFNTEKGKKSLKHVKSWAFKMKGELLEKIEKVKDIDESTYNKIVDDLTEKYQKIKGMTVEEVTELTKELKSNWKKIKDEVKKTQLLQSAKPKSKPKSKPAPKKVAKTPTK